MDNPFSFGVFVDGEKFYDRIDERGDLYRYVRDGRNVVLYGPRRYGKSSLAAQVAARLRSEGVTCIWFDMMKVNSVEHFVNEYATAVYRARSRVERGIRQIASFFGRLRPKITIGQDGEASVGVDLSARAAEVSTIEDVLGLAEKAGGKGRVAVFFDEFQEIGRLSPDMNLERIFRSVVQRQKNVSYVFLGSKTHTLRRMFSDASRPFYESATLMRIGKPPAGESAAFVRERLRSGGLDCTTAVAKRIVEVAANIPYYIQSLGAEIFDSPAARDRGKVSTKDVAAAAAKIRRQKGELFEARMDAMSACQRTLLCALAREPTAQFGEDYRRKWSLPAYTTVVSAVKTLLDRGSIEQENGEYGVSDPFFRSYLTEDAFTV